MAFTFIVEDGSVVTGANSYVSVEEADDYLVANIHVSATWSALSTDEKQYLLVWGTRYLDQRAVWNGYKTDETSPLRWPRTGVYDRDKVLIGINEIPQQLKEGVIEMARYLISDDRSVERGQDGLESLKVDVIELVFDKDYRLAEVPNELQYILQNLGYVRAGSSTFAKIKRA